MHFSKEHLEYFCFTLLKTGMKPADLKINAFKNDELPQDVKDIRSRLGMVNYLKHFIPDFGSLKYPLRQLTHKTLHFYGEMHASFNILNHLLTDAAINT